ncbi:hypothetical protein PAMH19_2768 [Pseudomonas aeruginosa]|nr:hypothetical protein PAMH19_2768 [Pseudomonas aeruginosa]
MPSRPHHLSERFGPRRPCLVVNPGGGAAAPRASWLQPSFENNFPAAARLPRAANSFRLPALHCVSTASGAASPSPAGRITTRTRWARTLFNRKENIMANIGTFTAEKDGFTGTLRTLTLNVKAKLVPNDKGDNEKAPDFRLQAASHDIGAAWKKTSEAGREYISVTLDDPSFPATVYARLIESEDGTHDLIWSRSKPQAA